MHIIKSILIITEVPLVRLPFVSNCSDDCSSFVVSIMLYVVVFVTSTLYMLEKYKIVYAMSMSVYVPYCIDILYQYLES